MVHRDIKPHNLMLMKGQVKILDFGLARLAEERRRTGFHPAGPEQRPASQPLTAFGTMLGTPDYIAPEQINDSHRADIRADVYSLGCTLYFLLTGRPPFPGGTLLEKALSHRDTPPESVISLRPGLPPELAGIVERMMAKDPAQRYQTPAEVVAALAPFTRAAPQPVAELVASPTPMPVQRPATPTQGARGRRRGLIPVVLGAVACLVVASAAVALLTPRGPGDGSPKQVPPAVTRQVLYVLPPYGFWFPDYENVKEALEERHIRMRTASVKPQARPHPTGKGRKEPAQDLTVDYLLDDVHVADFDAVIVGGGPGVQQFMRGEPSHDSAERVIAGMYLADKPVAALCMGPAVLAEVEVHGKSLLAGKRATIFNPDMVRDKLKDTGVQFVSQPIVVDGRIITARHWNDANGLVTELVAALGRTEKPKAGK
jgi:putative intracellular protease/amidase